MKERKDRNLTNIVLALLASNPITADATIRTANMIPEITQQLLSRRDFIKSAGVGLGSFLSLAFLRGKGSESASESDVLAFSSIDNRNGIAMVINKTSGTVSAYVGQPTPYQETDNTEATALLNAVQICQDQPLRLVESKDLGKGKSFDVYEIDNIIYQPEVLLLKEDLRSPSITIPEAEDLMRKTYGEIATFGKARITIATTDGTITGVTFKISRNETIPTLPESDPKKIKSETVRLFPLTLAQDNVGTEFVHEAGSRRFYMRGRISEVQSPEPALPAEAKKYSEAELDQMTPEEKIEVSPEIEGLIKSNVSTIKGELVIYRDENNKAIKAYNLSTAQEITLIEAGIAEIDLANGTKLESRAFTDSQTAVQYVADNSVWHNGDRQIVSAQLKADGIKDSVIALNLLINLKNGRGIYPPYPENENPNWFLIYIIEYPNNNNVDRGLILTYIDRDLNAQAVVLNDPDIDDSITGLSLKIKDEMKLKTP